MYANPNGGANIYSNLNGGLYISSSAEQEKARIIKTVLKDGFCCL